MLEAATTKAKEVLAIYGRNSLNYMILISDICRTENIIIDIHPMRNSYFSGMLWKQGDQYFILCNSRLAPTRKLFTIAHEIGHYFLHRTLQQSFTCQTIFGQSSDIRERQANFFAAELLMPEKIMIKYIENNVSPKRIAKDLGVSEEAIKYRVKQLTTQDLFN